MMGRALAQHAAQEEGAVLGSLDEGREEGVDAVGVDEGADRRSRHVTVRRLAVGRHAAIFA
jgi:hypothetical protein